MKIKFKKGPKTDKTFSFMIDIPKKFKVNSRANLYQVGQDLVRYAVTGIEREEKTGRLYRVYKKDGRKHLGGVVRGTGKKIKGVHKASAPGEFPAILNGDYIRSLDFSLRGVSQLEFGSKDKKARWLEEGTGKMAPRPALGKAIKAREKEAFNYLKWEALLFGKK